MLLSGLQIRAENILQRSGFLDELGDGTIFWSADQAILSMEGALAPSTHSVDEISTEIDQPLVVMPLEGRAENQV